MLKNLLDQKKCFKLICGAGNENVDEVEKLVAIYAKAGCHFFDLSANEKVIKAAEKGLSRVISEKDLKDYHLCLSVGIKGEPHLNKVKIDQKKCKECKKCIKICPQKAIAVCKDSKWQAAERDFEESISKKFEVKEEKCIGCLRCSKVCKYDAIKIYQKNKPIEEIITKKLLSKSELLSCLELHASGEDEEDVSQRWEYLNENFDGILSICIDRSKLGNEAILKRIKRLVKDRKQYTTIIQADGAPMSGGEDDFKTTLQAVAMAEIFQKDIISGNLPVYILLSGGTNSKTAELANLCGININGVSVGSYARKIVKQYIEKEDFLNNKTAFNDAVKVASNLIEKLAGY